MAKQRESRSKLQEKASSQPKKDILEKVKAFSPPKKDKLKGKDIDSPKVHMGLNSDSESELVMGLGEELLGQKGQKK